MVGAERLELSASCSQSTHATNCATPRHYIKEKKKKKKRRRRNQSSADSQLRTHEKAFHASDYTTNNKDLQAKIIPAVSKTNQKTPSGHYP